MNQEPKNRKPSKKLTSEYSIEDVEINIISLNKATELDFDLYNHRPKENTLTMEEYKDKCKRIVTRNRKTLERNLKTTGLPTDMMVSEEKDK